MRTIRDLLHQTIIAIQTDWGFASPCEPLISVPTVKTHGDYSTNVAMLIWSSRTSWPVALQGKWSSPQQVAQALGDQVQQQLSDHIQSVSVAGPGFLNFVLTDHYLYSLISFLTERDLNDQILEKNKPLAIVEYSSPNIAKPFTIGHLRSTIIGDAIAKLYQATGWEVKRDNHLGDWGTQFGKQIYALVNLGKGSLAANLAELEKSEQPVKYLVQLYVEFHEVAEKQPQLEDEARAWFKKLEDGDAEARHLWQLCIEYSWREFDQIYSKLGVTFTENDGRGYGESYFEDKMVVVSEELDKAAAAGKLEYKVGENGAKLVFFPNEELPPLMIIKKDGATLYATRDLAADYWRTRHYDNLQLVVNEVGAEQSLYFEQLYRTEELAGWFKPGQRVHVKHGLYRFADKKMSTRKGNVIWLADVLAEAEERAAHLAEGKTLPPGTATTVAIGALKWNDLKRSSHLDVTFDWDELLSMQGNSGPYIQYAYVRAAHILRKAGAAISSEKKPELSQELAMQPIERELVLLLGEFSPTIKRAASEFAPHHVCTYLFTLAQTFNSFYAQVSVNNEENELLRAWRLQLVTVTQATLQEGLGILGISTVEEM